MPRYAKFIAALAGAAGSSALALFAPDTWPFKVATIVVAVSTAVAVRQIPNATEE